MAKDKDKKPNEIYPAVDISYTNLKKLPIEYKDSIVASFDCSGNELINLSNCPKEVKGDFRCLDNKVVKMTQFHLGAGRFNDNGGDEDEEKNRAVRVGGSFITDVNTYKKPKIYDKYVGRKSKAEMEKEGFSESTSNSGEVSLGGGHVMYTGIKNPQLAFDAFGYSAKNKSSKVHANFNWRQGLRGGNSEYCGITKPFGLPRGWEMPPEGWNAYTGDKWKGWGEAPFNYNGMINWSFFVCHKGTGGGDESGTIWGSGQIVGTTIYDGQPLGAKTWSMQNRPVYYYLKNDPTLYRRPAKEIYYAKKFTTLEAEFRADFLSNIRVALPVAGGPHILNDKLTNSTAYDGDAFPFFGKVSNGTYFAGYGESMSTSAKKVKTYFNKKGLKVEWMDNGDGGGSIQLYAKGKAIRASGRPVPAIIGWNE